MGLVPQEYWGIAELIPVCRIFMKSRDCEWSLTFIGCILTFKIAFESLFSLKAESKLGMGKWTSLQRSVCRYLLFVVTAVVARQHGSLGWNFSKIKVSRVIFDRIDRVYGESRIKLEVVRIFFLWDRRLVYFFRSYAADGQRKVFILRASVALQNLVESHLGNLLRWNWSFLSLINREKTGKRSFLRV